MPIDMETFESADGDELHYAGETNAEKVLAFLASHPEQAFTQSEIRDATGVNGGSISVVLSRLEDRDLVRHKGHYWAIGDEDDLLADADFRLSARAANDRFGEEQLAEWVEHAVDEG